MNQDYVIIEKLLNEAINELPKLIVGNEFLVSDLFRGYEWKNLSHNIRLQLGRDFYREILKNHNRIEPLEKNINRPQKYIVRK